MPVDWMVLFIYVIGIFGLLEILKLIPRPDQRNEIIKSGSKEINLQDELKSTLPFLIVFLLIGSILSIRELIPSHNQSMSKSEICSHLEKNISKDKYPLVKEKAIQVCNDDNSTALEGEIIYPRFFERRQGFYDNQADIFYGKQDFSRLMFRFSTDDISKLYIPLSGINANIRIPNGSSAIILADSDQLPKIQLIVLKDRKDILFYSNEFLPN